MIYHMMSTDLDTKAKVRNMAGAKVDIAGIKWNTETPGYT